MESLLVVINPDASVDEHVVQNAIDVLRAEADVQVCRISMPGDLDGALHRRGGRTVVVAGGDWHLHTVVAALHRRNELDDTVLAMLPDGSDGDFADGAGIPDDPEAAARVVLGGAERRFDLIADCRGSVIVNTVRLGRFRGSWHGFLGQRAALVEHRRMLVLGRPGLPRDAARPRPLRVRIEADDVVVADFDRPVAKVTLSNAPSRLATPQGVLPFGADRLGHKLLGGAVRGTPKGGAASRAVAAGDRGGRGGRQDVPMIAPDADPTDGLADMEVCFAPAVTARARRAFRLPEPEVRQDLVRVQARRIRIAGQRFWLNCDGQDSGTERRCTWKVVPSRLRMIVPASAAD